MYLHRIKPKENFDEFLVKDAGYHGSGGYDYIESRYIAEISASQSNFLTAVTEELYKMCLEAVDKVIIDNRFKDFCIGPAQAEHIKASWQRDAALPHGQSRDPELYGRFDFCWDGGKSIKFYEINGDTPTTAYECAVVQWVIAQELADRQEIPSPLLQFNSLEEKIVARLAHMHEQALKKGIDLIHFTSMTDWKEDLTTTSYLEALARKSGWETKFIDIGIIGANENVKSEHYGSFFDAEKQKIKALYKLMPWEHIYESPYAPYVARDEILFIEPPWKAILSNKMLSVILWEMYPDHPYLLPTFTSAKSFGGTYVEKPIFGRISAGIKVVQNNIVTSTRVFDPDEPLGSYERYPKIYQQFSPLPEMPGLPGWRYLIGMWAVGGEAAGMDIRIDRSLVTGGGAIKFLPHFIGQ